MKKFLSLACLLVLLLSAAGQTTTTKNYPAGRMAGEAKLLYSYGDYNGSVSSTVIVADVLTTNYYFLRVLVCMDRSRQYRVYIDNSFLGYLTALTDGWQYRTVNTTSVKLSAGKRTIRIIGTDAAVPMTEEVYLYADVTGRGTPAIPVEVEKFLEKTEQLKSKSVLSETENVEVVSPSKVLPNPEGEYSHAIDTAFVYSHFSWVYLNPGTYTFTTSGSTVSRALAVFNPSNYTQSSSNVNGGPGGESSVTMSVASAAYYAIMLRPASSGASGTTNILMNGSTIVSNAVIGGKYYSMPALRGGDMNFFTCKISGDTRIFTSRYPSSSIRGYNDDYSGGGGTWNWGLSSRIKKNFNGIDSVQYTFVCAYSPTSTGICDIYMGCGNGNVPLLEPQNFPLYTVDDAIRTGTTGYYNCISWSGGITSSWIWPPYALSTYNCNGAPVLQCFDNFYSNNPVRYPGAWNYTRTGATEANSVVDLWKTASAYQHASVKEPGNNHPHGYDWESKPGSLWRTLHPRYALTNANWYGSVSNYYKPTGTYARNSAESVFTTDADAVKAGLAIFDRASLTKEADEKLKNHLQKTSRSLSAAFEVLYKVWDATKAANSSLSDPEAYCKNKEYKALEKFALANKRASMLLTFDKFMKGDHIIGVLMLTLTMDKYSKLLDEVKAERFANPYDKEGRYRIHGDYDNGVLYIEKILKELPEEIISEPVVDDVTVNVSPNPVMDKLTVQLVTKKESKISIMITSAQTGAKQVLQKEIILNAGTHRFETSVKDIAGGNGNILAVQVVIDGVMKTVKVMVMK